MDAETRWMPVVTGFLLLLILLIWNPLGCGKKDRPKGEPLGRPLQVVATTTIVGDVVGQVGGQRIELYTLLPVGADPHSWTPTPEALAKVSEADIIFINGIGLEGSFLDNMVQQSGSKAKVVSVSNGIRPRHFQEMADTREVAGAAKRIRALKEDGRVDSLLGDKHHAPMQVSEPDPHVWLNPHNVMVWAANIQDALGKADITNGEYFAEKANWYKTKLIELDGRLTTRLDEIPPLKRRLVTDHLFLGYFADRYGFTQVGAVLPGSSSLAEPSAKELSRLEEIIRRMKVPAIFAGKGMDVSLAKRVAEDLGTDLRLLYTGSLSEEGEGAGNYIHYMEYNVEQIAEGLNPPRPQVGDPTRPGGVLR